MTTIDDFDVFMTVAETMFSDVDTDLIHEAWENEDDLYNEIKAVEIPSDEVEYILADLGVEDEVAKFLLETFVKASYDFDDVVKMVAKEVYRETCQNCNDEEIIVDGYYDHEFVNVTGEINGSSIDVVLCPDCYHKAAMILGI